MRFEDFFGYECVECEEIWFLGVFNDVQIRFGHVIYCGASANEWVEIENLGFPDEETE